MAGAREKRKSSKLSIDDTIPLICAVESGDKHQDHILYTIKIQRGVTSDVAWLQKKRYSDFTSLDSDLRIAGIELPLPPKKIIGNFDRDFVAERQKGLQEYLAAILCHPPLARSLPLKRFLDPDNYNVNFVEEALQHVSMVLRSEKKWEVIEPLPDIGWRIRKQFILVKPLENQKVKQMLSWVEYGPYRFLPDKELSALMTVLSNIKHPNIQTPVLSTCNENGGLIIRPYCDKGTLKDFLYKCKPKGHCLKKYAVPPSKGHCLDVQTIKVFGRQILETLSLLHEKGLPFGHLHTGNIVIENNTCKLLDLENWLIGLPSYYRQFILQFKKIQTLELIDVYSFGHVLYEMTFGRELQSESCNTFPLQCDAQLRSVLESILMTEACKNGIPSVQDLLTHPFFSDVKLPSAEKPYLKIPSKIKEPLKKAKEEYESRLKEEQKAIYRLKRVSKAKQYHMSEDVKKERRKSKRKALENGDVSKKEADSPGPISVPASPATAAPPSAPAAPAAPAPPPPPPAPAGAPPPPPPPAAPAPPPPGAPPPPAAAAPPPPSAGRGALLSSITGFSKNGLKKAVTVDKSGPKL